MKIKQFEIWIASLDPWQGTETGKTRPVLVVQTDLLNSSHPSTLICPITTNVQPKAVILRIHLTKGMAGIKEDCDVMMDQIRAIDNKRLIKRIGKLPENISKKVMESIRIVFDFQD